MSVLFIVLAIFVLLGWIGARTTRSDGLTYDTRVSVNWKALVEDSTKAKDAVKARLPKKEQVSPTKPASPSA